MDINFYFDQAKKKLNITSDYALAKAIGTSQPQIVNCRKNKRIIDLYTIFRICEILEKDPLEMITQREAENEKNPDKKEYWESVQKSYIEEPKALNARR